MQIFYHRIVTRVARHGNSNMSVVCCTSGLPKQENVLCEIISEVMCNKCSHDLCGVNAIISNLSWLSHCWSNAEIRLSAKFSYQSY